MSDASTRTEQAGRLRDALLILLLGSIAFSVGLSPEFLGMDARFALFLQNMLRTGPTFFPISHLGPYADYPATTILPSYALSLLIGRVTPLAVALPTAVVSGAVLAMTYLIGAVRSRRWGLYAVCLAALTFSFMHSARSFSPDQYSSLMTAGCFYLAHSAQAAGRKRRLLGIPLLFAIGFACRGPIGLIIPAAVVGVFYWGNRNLRGISATIITAVVLLGVGGMALWTAAKHEVGNDFARQAVTMQAFGRVHGEGKSVVYYWLTAPATYAAAYPLAVLLVAFRWRAFLHPRDDDHRLLRHAAAWAIIILLGMSLPADKKARYILPAVPALALVASYLFVGPPTTLALRWIRTAFRELCLLMSPATTVACSVLAFAGSRYVVDRTASVSAAMVCAIVSLCILRRYQREAGRRGPSDLFALVCGAISFAMIFVGMTEPIRYARNKSRPFAAGVKELQGGRTTDPIVFYRLGPDWEDVILAANYDGPLTATFVESPAGLLRLGEVPIGITTEQEAREFPPDIAARMTLRMHGSLSGEQCVVFSLK